ncbi:MAG TPA: TonB family protein [Nitrospira sp.]|nr:TonB family protein [Nitrospira sp.]
MTAATLSGIGTSSHKPHGWVASMLLHLFAVGVSIFLFTELKPAAELEPFHWEISLAQVAQPSPQVQPPTPVPPQPKRIVQPPPAPAKPVETRPTVQRVQTVQAVQRVEPVVRQEQVAVQQINPMIESIAQHAEPVQQERHTEQTTEAVQRAEAIEVPVAAVTTPVPVSQPAPVTQPEPTAVTEVATHHEPVVTNAPVVAEVPVLKQQPAVEAAPQAVEVPAPAGETAQVASSHPLVERPAMVAPRTKTDYSWLTQELVARLEQSKRYPYLARMNRWQGKVVVQAVVRDDGQVVSLKIAESSGHTILDNDAMELIRKISPLQLKHPLGRSQVALLVPVGYALQ